MHTLNSSMIGQISMYQLIAQNIQLIQPYTTTDEFHRLILNTSLQTLA